MEDAIIIIVICFAMGFFCGWVIAGIWVKQSILEQLDDYEVYATRKDTDQ